MATFYFHEETVSGDDDGAVKLVRYYYDDISAEILTRSFRLLTGTGQREFLDNERIPLADLRSDLKQTLTRALHQRLPQSMRIAS